MSDQTDKTVQSTDQSERRWVMPDGQGGYRFAATSDELVACAQDHQRQREIYELRANYREATAALDRSWTAARMRGDPEDDYVRVGDALTRLATALAKRLGYEGTLTR